MCMESMIRRIPLFDPVDDNALPELARSLESIQLDAGRILFCEDDPGDCFYMIVEGCLEIIKAFGTPEERVLQTWSTGNYLGEMSMFDPDRRRSATVRARTPATLLKMGHEAFRGLLRRRPDLALEITRQLSLRLSSSDNATIHDLQEKNRQLASSNEELASAYARLRDAQQQIIEKERLEHELLIARQIQESILPHTLPAIPGVELGAMIRPARAVGGDLYDLIALEGNCLGAMIGDVSDKGVPAAIFMALARSLLRAEAARMSPPAAVLREVNRHLLDMNTAGLFITVIYGVLSCADRRFTFVRAGHEIPFFFRKDGTGIFPANDHGQALGLFENVVLEELSITLPPGSRIVLFTDGATDAVNPDNERFGRERLRQAMRHFLLFSAQEFCEAMFETIARFQNGAPQADDMAMVAIDIQ